MPVDIMYVVFYLFLFKERDKSGSGYINYEQLEEIYRVYQVCWTIFLFVFFLSRNSSRSIKVDLDDTKAGKVQDRTGRPTEAQYFNFFFSSKLEVELR